MESKQPHGSGRIRFALRLLSCLKDGAQMWTSALFFPQVFGRHLIILLESPGKGIDAFITHQICNILDLDRRILLQKPLCLAHADTGNIFGKALLGLLLEKFAEIGVAHIDGTGYVIHADFLIVMALDIFDGS